jgi:hypothetical protein
VDTEVKRQFGRALARKIALAATTGARLPPALVELTVIEP